MSTIVPLTDVDFSEIGALYLGNDELDALYVCAEKRWPVDVYVDYITVTTLPSKISYVQGEALDLTGMKVIATYSNGSTADVTDSCTTVPDDGDTLSVSGTISIPVSYSQSGRTVVTFFSVSVSAAVTLQSITVTSLPNKVFYGVGDTIDLTGYSVTAKYSDESTADITRLCTPVINGGATFDSDGHRTVSLSYTENGVTLETAFVLTCFTRLGNSTYLYLEVTSAREQKLFFEQTAADGVTIDWGDESTAGSMGELSGNISHTYTYSGGYVIQMTTSNDVTWTAGQDVWSLFGVEEDKTDTTPELVDVFIGDGCTSFWHTAFANCTSLESITFGKDVETIQDKTANYTIWTWNYGCVNLKEFIMPEENQFFSVVDGVLYSKDLSAVLRVPQAYDHTYSIPNHVTSIGKMAFCQCLAVSGVFTIPNRITNIGNGAFYDCNSLTGINIFDLSVWCSFNFAPTGETPSLPFEYAHNLYLNGSLVTALVIPSTVTSIPAYAFYHCDSITSAQFPSDLLNIGEYAFYECDALTSINIVSTSTTFGINAFYGCDSLESVYVNSLDAWLSYTFSGSFGNPVYYAHALYVNNVELTSLTIPNNIQKIPDYSFAGCTSITSVTISSGVEEIGVSAFDGCSSVTQVVIPNSVTDIGYSAFQSCNMTSITLPDGITTINGSVFNRCSALININIPLSVTSIGGYAFQGCSALCSINIPSSVTSIGNNAFSGCSGITSITIPASVQSISSNAFGGCTGLLNAEIAATSISNRAFNSCSSLTKVWIRSTTTTITEIANKYFGPFYQCNAAVLYLEASSAPSGFATYWDHNGTNTIAKHYNQTTSPF